MIALISLEESSFLRDFNFERGRYNARKLKYRCRFFGSIMSFAALKNNILGRLTKLFLYL